MKSVTLTFKFDFFFLKTKLEILNFELTLFTKKGNKDMNHRKIVTSLYDGYPKPMVYFRKNRCINNL